MTIGLQTMSIDPRRISRREFARLSAAATVAAMVSSGCRELGSKAVHIRFWNGFTGPDGPAMLKIVRGFNASQNQVQVTMQRTEWGIYYNKLFVAGLGGRAPEVFAVHSDTLERFIWAKLLDPVDALFAGPDAINAEDIDENILAAARRGKTMYALPLDVHPMGVFYNKKLFAQAGIDRPPETRDEFLDACRRMNSGSGSSRVWGFVYEWRRINLYSILRQWGGEIVSEDGKTVKLDAPEAIAAMDFAGSLILKDKLVSPIENIDAMIGFRQGRIGMIWGGSFLLNEVLKQTDLEFGAAEVPQLGEQRATWSGSHQLCVRAGLDERERAAAHTFFKYLSNNSLGWAEAGLIPARKSIRARPEFAALPVQSTFAKQIPYLQYMPSTPFTFEYQSEFDVATEVILRGEESAEEALKTASMRIRAAAARFETPAPQSGGVA